MAIKLNDTKRLWGRSGSRCALCRLQLSAVDSEAVLGEMAHIVAQSADGPRGRSPLTTMERDSYSNLILLCPNDHASIDDNPGEWSVERLHTAKAEHEHWVQDLLDSGSIKPVEIDSSEYRRERINQWISAYPGHWCYVSVSPLQVVDEAIDPLDEALRATLATSELPGYLQSLFGVHPNPYCIEPSANGLVVENFLRITDGMGYRMEIFRTGYLEYVVCFKKILERIDLSELVETPVLRPEGLGDHRKVPCARALEYDLWAKTLIAQLKVVHALSRHLPFNDVVLAGSLLGIEGTCLLVRYGWHDKRIGRAAEDGALHHSVVVPRESPVQSWADLLLRRFVNYLGLDLPSSFDEKGGLLLPTSLKQAHLLRGL